MYKIAVVGDYDSIYGFATLGLDIFPVTSRKEAEEKLEHLAASEIWDHLYHRSAGSRDAKDELINFRNNCFPPLS